jgi:predicted component of type VI protein secretion system
MSVEDRVLKLEGFAADVREMTRVITELIRRHDERLTEREQHAAEQDSQTSNLNAKIEALVDAQIRTEDALARLAEAQAHTDKRLDALIDIVAGGK